MIKHIANIKMDLRLPRGNDGVTCKLGHNETLSALSLTTRAAQPKLQSFLYWFIALKTIYFPQ
ncbi:hypothetical protein Ltuc_1490 [Legionella tucsonensis]|uniref:Uncharacterized protein n=1 Tax=Legionella tucsonensis TaxID=40335 RepID=A0A0W0ZWV9_9GAMM|nr:hypothetical protein Ltuc_1490 [Legionella tucsonensis]